MKNQTVLISKGLYPDYVLKIKRVVCVYMYICGSNGGDREARFLLTGCESGDISGLRDAGAATEGREDDQ